LRFLFYSHDGFGLGHIRRNLAVATALTELSSQASVLLATGYDDIHRLSLPGGVTVLKLPSLRKVTNDHYTARRMPIGSADLFVLRSALLKAAVKSFRPDVMLVDKHPLGVKKELQPALKVHREAGGLAALGLRDILDNRVTVLKEWHTHDLHAKIECYYDRLLIYGDRHFYDSTSEYEFTAAMIERSRFCGFVVGKEAYLAPKFDDLPPAIPQPNGRPVVLATAGGGEDGFAMLQVFISAAREAAWQGLVVTGPMMSEEERQALQLLATETDVMIYDFVPELHRWFGRVDALVCMGGYNTVWEALHQGTPTVCVPRARPRQEQLIRTQALAKLGVLRVVEPEHLEADGLRLAIEAALQQSRQDLSKRSHAILGFGGGHQAARHLIELAEQSAIRLERIQQSEKIPA